MTQLQLIPMSDDMYHEYFKEYENDLDLYFDKSQYKKYIYSKDKVENYIKHQKDLNRISLGIINDNEIIGEILIKNIDDTSATIGIALKNDKYKNKGYGSIAESLVIDYIFNILNKEIVFADSIITNEKSQHVLLKNGFEEINRNDKFIYYKRTKK